MIFVVTRAFTLIAPRGLSTIIHSLFFTPITKCGLRMNSALGSRRGFAQARQRALLAMDKSCEFRVGQHERKFRRDVRSAERADRRARRIPAWAGMPLAAKGWQ